MERDTPDVRHRYQRALRKQAEVKKLVLPEGVSRDNLDQIRELWENVDFSNTSEDGQIEATSKIDYKRLARMFVPPYPLVQQTRTLAEEGRRLLERKKAQPSVDPATATKDGDLP